MSETRFYPVVTNNTDSIEKLDGQIIFDIDNKSISIDIDNSRFAVQSVDSELSEISKNPVQNKVIAEKLYDIEEKLSEIETPEIPELPTDIVRGTGKLFTLNSEEAIQEHLTYDDLGALISYIGENVYDEVVHQPIAIEVGDTIDTLYFDTDVEPDFSQLEYDRESIAVLISGHDSDDALYEVCWYDLSTITEGASNAYCMLATIQSENIVPIYSTEEVSAELLGVPVSKGWNTNEVAYGGPVQQVNQDTLWNSYISKEPFAEPELKYEKNSVYVVAEIIAENPTNIGDSVTQVYFDTAKSAEEIYNLLANATFDFTTEGFSVATLFGTAAWESDANPTGQVSYVVADIDENGNKLYYLINEDDNGVFWAYSPTADPSVIEAEAWGWQKTSPFTAATPFTIAYMSNKAAWSSWLSAHENGFDSKGISAKKVGGNDNKAPIVDDVFITKTADEVNALLVKENIGKLVSYVGEGGAYKKNTLYMVAEKEIPEIEAGDIIDTLYFDTSITPDLTELTANAEGYAQLITSGTHGDYGVFYYDMSILSEGSINAYCLMAMLASSGMPVIIYSTAPFNMGGTVAAEGWNIGQLDWQDIVAEVSQQDIWDSYISKEPFSSGASIIAKPIFDASLEKSELPEVSAADAGKVLSVTSNGTWAAAAPETAFQQINISLSDTSFVTKDIDPNVFYVFDQPLQVSLTINLNEGKPGVMHEYMFQFSVGYNLTLNLPGNVRWINQESPTFTAGHTYQVSILNNLAVYGEF